MNKIWRTLVGTCLLFVFAACSTKPQKHYDITTMQSISYSLLDLADRKRQLRQFEQALLLYSESEDYAIKRNDKQVVGLAMLKRAAIYIELGQVEKAKVLIQQVDAMVKHEEVPLVDAVDFLNAKHAWLLKDEEKALSLLTSLQTRFAEVPEKHLYYKFVIWSYWPERYDLSQMDKALQALTQLKTERKMENIEIYSFALYQFLHQSVIQDSDRTPIVLADALSHFSQVELSNKILECFVLAHQFYVGRQDKAKSEYFAEQAKRLRASLLR